MYELLEGRRSVTERALVRRINRRLAAYSELLRKSRPGRMRQDLGDYFLMDCNRNFILKHHVDPEDLALELGVLTEEEVLVD